MLKQQDLEARVHLLGLNRKRLEAQVVSFIQIRVIHAETTSTDQVDEPERANLKLKMKRGVWYD